MELQLWHLVFDAIKVDTPPSDSPVVAGTGEVGHLFSDLNSIFIKQLQCAKPRGGHFYQHCPTCPSAIKLGR